MHENLKDDEFVDIPGFEGYYQVNKLGEFKSLARIVKGRNNYHVKKERPMTVHFNSYGYAVVSLSKNGEFKPTKVHLILARLFIQNPENKRTVNHIDANKSNYALNNLEWATDSEQQIHAFKMGLQIPRRGALNGMYGKIGNAGKGKDSVLSKIILDLKTGIYYFGTREASISNKINQGTLRAMLNGRIKNKTSLIYT